MVAYYRELKMTSSMLLVFCALVGLSMAAVAPPLKDDNVSNKVIQNHSRVLGITDTVWGNCESTV